MGWVGNGRWLDKKDVHVHQVESYRQEIANFLEPPTALLNTKNVIAIMMIIFIAIGLDTKY